MLPCPTDRRARVEARRADTMGGGEAEALGGSTRWSPSGAHGGEMDGALAEGVGHRQPLRAAADGRLPHRLHVLHVCQPSARPCCSPSLNPDLSLSPLLSSHLTSAATALGGAAPAASRSGEAGSAAAAAAGGGSGSPSARRTTRRTRNLRAAGGRGHRIILATIGGQKSTTSTKPTSTLENAVPEPNRRGEEASASAREERGATAARWGWI